MNKILLVYEDYADLMNVEGTLKKVGFDVIGLTNEYTVAEQVLAFNPDLVIGAGRGGKVSSLGVGKRLKEMHRWQGKSVLIFQPQIKPDPQDLIRIRVDMILEAPVSALRLMQVAAKLLGHDESVLLARLNKVNAEAPPGKGFTLSNTTAVGGKFNTDSEAIYIKGRTEEVDRAAEERALSAEKIENDEGVNFSLNSEAAEDSGRMSFRFGDRMSSAEVVRSDSGDSAEDVAVFADVNLRELEQELLGGGAPQMERIESSPPLLEQEQVQEQEAQALMPQKAGTASGPEELLPTRGEADEMREIQAKAHRELQNVEKTLKARMERYASMVADVKVAPKSTVSRVEARRRQKQIAAEWDQENLKELDELRREFTKAMFKK